MVICFCGSSAAILGGYGCACMASVIALINGSMAGSVVYKMCAGFVLGVLKVAQGVCLHAGCRHCCMSLLRGDMFIRVTSLGYPKRYAGM